MVLIIWVSLALANPVQYQKIGDFVLNSGETITECVIGYRTYGKLNSAGTNIIVMPTWFGGTTRGLESMIGPGMLADSTKYYIITVDALGDGISSSPSTSKSQPKAEFPTFTIRDMVRSQYQLLTRFLHISHVYAVIGASMGGMQAFQWSVSYPDFMAKVVPIVGSPALTSIDLLLWGAELRAINEGLECDASLESISQTVGAIQNYALWTPGYRVAHTPREKYPEYLQSIDKGFAGIFNIYNWRSQLKAMMSLDVTQDFNGSLEEAALSTKADFFIVVGLQDHMVNPTPAITFGKYVQAPVLKLDSDCGHLISGCERDTIAVTVNRFLSE